MTRFLLCLFSLMATLAASAHALPPAKIDAPETLATVPEALKPWVPWVMGDVEEKNLCPDNGRGAALCVWPSRLAIEVAATSGKFRQDVRVYEESWVMLPGSKEYWPQDVRGTDGKAWVVTERSKLPAVFLPAGKYTISGNILWDSPPDMLPLPAETGLVTLSVDGQPRPFFNIDSSSRLWIRSMSQAAETAAKGEADAIKAQVFRLVHDDVPLRVTTYIKLDVAGKSREEQLQGAMPDGFSPMRVTGNLPNRLENDGTLRVQVRPGSHVLTVESFLNAPSDTLKLPAQRPSENAQEIWSFGGSPLLRVVQIEGVPAIDPTQTEMPKGWQKHPAYIMDEKSAMTLTVQKRGLEAPDSDRLQQRRIWRLDSDGDGYTLRDTISGELSRSWRLNAQPATELGRVSINGQPQFITTLDASSADAPRGVEVRPGSVQLEADSRFAATSVFPARLPAIGWQHDMNAVNLDLRLPAGWSLLGAQGVDNVSASWVRSWSLLDVFLVMIAVVAAFKLMGGGTAAVLAVALVLIHPENAFFTSAALTVLLAMALLRVVPKGRFRSGVALVRRGMLLLFVLAALPFMVVHVRDAIYPQLRVNQMSGGGQDIAMTPRTFQEVSAGIASGSVSGSYSENVVTRTAPPAAPPVAMPMIPAPSSPRVMFDMSQSAPMKSAGEVKREAEQMVQQLYQYDANTNVQTGFGVPEDFGTRILLSWNGPVQQNDTFSLWLVTPAMNLLLALLRMVLLAALFVFLLGIPLGKTTGGSFTGRLRSALAVAVLAGVALMQPDAAQAASPYPPAEMLKELRERITKEMEKDSECQKECVSVSRAKVFAAADELTVFMEVHVARDKTAVALPGGVGNWRPSAVLVNGVAAAELRQIGDGYLYVVLPKGVHEVTMNGALPLANDSIGFKFSSVPGHIEAAGIGWEVQGIRPNGNSDGNLQLLRLKDADAMPQDANAEALESRQLPDFFAVERMLDLGLSWQVHTVVSRVTPSDRAASIAVPLLEGESLMTSGVEVKDGRALLHFAAGEQAKRLQSTLKPRDAIVLKAPATTKWAETWRLNASSVWHVAFEGIPRIADGDNAKPTWRPWPNEQVTVTVAKPHGVEGATLTIDSTEMRVKAGESKASHDLRLTLRSSQGGQHELILPEGADLQKVEIDGRASSIQQKDRSVMLPVNRGQQSVTLNWLQDNPMALRYRLPPVDVGVHSVNSTTHVELPRDRWLLLVDGPRMGPAILLWGWVPVLLIIALGLARVPGVPLRTHHWFLLLLGLSQTNMTVIVVVAGWFLAMAWREQNTSPRQDAWFNLRQVLLGCWTVLSLLLLFYGIKNGLLGLPDMHVTGNGSSSFRLQWYQDITANVLPQPDVISAPLWVYRGLMLLWALWLAFSLVRWLKWAWECFSQGGYWYSIPAPAKAEEARRSPILPPAPAKGKEPPKA